MKKNRFIAYLWMGFIVLLLVVIVGYIIFAIKENPYFRNISN